VGQPDRARRDQDWWRTAVVYQVYVRSFADGDGDGTGDLAGVRSRLPYLAELGVDALWFTPWYLSPMKDGGYDVADYRAIDPAFGTLAEAEKLIAEARELGIRTIVDIVPNHVSDQHPWFREARAGGPERELFHFRPGRGADGQLPPNDWRSEFGGPAWTRLDDGDWYLHLFAPEQPDLNWEHPEVRAEFRDILRFWLDRGVDGLRIDVAHGLVKAPGLPDSYTAGGPVEFGGAETPYFDQDGVHHIYREWRSILDSYTPERIAVAEAWVPLDRTARYVRAGELHQAFNFGFLGTPWSGPSYRGIIDDSLRAMGSVGAPTTWGMSNHHVARHASRRSTGVGGVPGGVGPVDGAMVLGDREVGQRRARAATLLMLALPGSAYLYQGEELGLPEVVDLPAEARQDPIFERTGGTMLGRDGCRVPLPWSGDHPPYGFGPDGSTPWLPQPAEWASLSVEAQDGRSSSTLSLYRQALRLRRELEALGDGELRWRSEPDSEVLVFERPSAGRTVVCAVNLGTSPVLVPVGELLLASDPLTADGLLPPDVAAWWLM
jgi:alpha-glucosidase